jgi:quercetin dioxygenase-like cupin family protein
MIRRAFLAALAALLIAGVASAQDNAIETETLLQTGTTVVDQPIAAYPDGTPEVTSLILTIAPGGETGWHTHPVPLFVHVLEGEVTVDYGAKGVNTYSTGTTFMEAMDWPHNGMNRTDAPVRIFTVYIGEEGVPGSQPVE